MSSKGFCDTFGVSSVAQCTYRDDVMLAGELNLSSSSFTLESRVGLYGDVGQGREVWFLAFILIQE